MRIAVISNIVRVNPAEAIERFLAAVGGRCEVSFGLELCGVAGEGPYMADEELFPSCDVAVVFGGDGTILTAARRAAPYGVPIFGVNTGHLGFLSSASADETGRGADELLEGELDLTERIMLKVRVLREDQEAYSAVALNDIVVGSAYARLSDFSVSRNGQFVAQFNADGIIVSTPTGSTAYSLSCGAPLVFPGLDLFLITPICPHLLGVRPMVVPSEGTVEVRVRGSEVFVTADGQEDFPLKEGDVVKVSKTDYKAKLLSPKGQDFFNLVRQKLTS